ncbi:guanine-N(7)-methyltransferase [Pisolithus orientalis]|uniref:guanine-N(7)-methyltransferase n=1 Tax=Pisolithus orientalis TaxID=936130 RepID=UPI0022253BE5|nr:guanine-N(7)-methyltransferase [Pisolithus orientalis]KAI6028341.1 guanine-N(7)-methyltransferase [Pisolithus orientalis]
MSQPPRPVASSVPYNPRNRRTPAGSVLVPMTPQEIEMYKHYRGIGTQSLLAKRKRSRSTSPDDPLCSCRQAPRWRRRKGSSNTVSLHPIHQSTHITRSMALVFRYSCLKQCADNLRPEVGVKQRLRSPIIGLKNFNNWVKSVLITRFAHPVLATSTTKSIDGPSGGRGKVLDMGCGKGGDLVKWEKARIRELIGVDIADVSIEQARDRWKGMRPPRFTASFAALDCYTESLSKAFPPEKLAQPFDVVSMQFCMHYAFETAEKARCMLQNISQWLRKGGVFLGTIPNADYLLERLDSLPSSATDLSFGNSVYKIRFEDRRSRRLFGHRYYFWLQDAVDDVPEYIVCWDKFVELAAEYALYPIYKEEFHQIFAEHRDEEEFKSLMLRMKVVDANGESAMDEEQWEAANIYIGFAFEKGMIGRRSFVSSHPAIYKHP